MEGGAVTVWLAQPPRPVRAGLLDRLWALWQGSLPPEPDPTALTEVATRLALVEAQQTRNMETINQLSGRVEGLVKENARLDAVVRAKDEKIAYMQSALDGNAREREGYTARFMSYDSMIGGLQYQNEDQNKRMVIMRGTIDGLQEQIGKMSLRIKEIPKLRHRGQVAILHAEVWKRYAEDLRALIGDSAPPIPEMPAIPEFADDSDGE